MGDCPATAAARVECEHLPSLSRFPGLALSKGDEFSRLYEAPLFVSILISEWLLLGVHMTAVALGRASTVMDAAGCWLQAAFRTMVVLVLVCLPPDPTSPAWAHTLRVFCAGNTAFASFALGAGVVSGQLVRSATGTAAFEGMATHWSTHRTSRSTPPPCG